MILPLATAIGVWGGFPKPPEIFMKLARNELFQYLLVFIWIYQSYGSKQDIQTALIATVVLFLVTKFLDLRKILDSVLSPSAPPPLAPPMVLSPPLTPPVVLPPPPQMAPEVMLPEQFYGRH